MSGMLPEDEARFRIEKLVVAYTAILDECSALAYADAERLQLPKAARNGLGAIWARDLPYELTEAKEAVAR